ncbi:hypothetical protein RIEGSTA812A_PEG_685 [invertebrate metagenome]|uniref:Uncharacterized protein n=1 Tax=invertebrate metagenome TaxID=1711999 RepID=A0A484HBN5_9ZZZZ
MRMLTLTTESFYGIVFFLCVIAGNHWGERLFSFHHNIVPEE